jgi:hypothetical protein
MGVDAVVEAVLLFVFVDGRLAQLSSRALPPRMAAIAATGGVLKRTLVAGERRPLERCYTKKLICIVYIYMYNIY